MPSVRALAVFDDSRDAVVAVAEDGVCLYANDAALRLYRAPDLVGRQIDGLRTRRSAMVAASQWARFRRDGELSDELEIQLPGGDRAWLQFRAVADYLPGVHLAVVRPRDEDGTRSRAADVARLQAPGTLFRAAFETAPAASMIMDTGRRVVLANRLARRILGLANDQVGKRKLDDFAPPEVRADLDRVWATFLDRGTLQGFSPVLTTHQLRRTIRFTARASIVPDRHMSIFSIEASPHNALEITPDSGALADPLSAREREVMTLLARGATGEEIAAYTELSPDTVRTHVRNAMRKLDAHTRPHAVVVAIRRGEIDP